MNSWRLELIPFSGFAARHAGFRAAVVPVRSTVVREP
jgi:hypothetical protein